MNDSIKKGLCQEKILIQQAKSGNADAMNRLIERHYPLIQELSKRVLCGRTEKETLIQAGSLGLIEAVKRYQSQRNVKLITYAVPWILGEMKKALRQEILPSADSYFEQKEEHEGIGLLERIAGQESIEVWRVDLHLAFEKLCREERELILLRYYEGKTQKETAETMQKSQAQISRIENRVLDTLRLLLA